MLNPHTAHTKQHHHCKAFQSVSGATRSQKYFQDSKNYGTDGILEIGRADSKNHTGCAGTLRSPRRPSILGCHPPLPDSTEARLPAAAASAGHALRAPSWTDGGSLLERPVEGTGRPLAALNRRG